MGFATLVALHTFVALFIGGVTWLGWFGVLLGLDRNRRDKGTAATLLTCALLGLLSIIPAFVLEYLLRSIAFGAFGDLFEGIPLLLGNILFTGQIEELCKFVVFLILMERLAAVKEPLDGLTHAAAVALGFSVAENILYAYYYNLEVQVARAFLTTPGHMVYAAIWGVYYASFRSHSMRSVFDHKGEVILYAVIPSAAVHGLFNWLLDVELMGLAWLLDGLTLAFVVYVYRRFLRFSPYRVSRGDRSTSVILKRALADHPRSYELNRRLAEHHMQSGSFAKALPYLNTCLGLKKGDLHCQGLKACALIMTDRVTEGTATLDAVVARMDSSSRWHLRRDIRQLLGINRETQKSGQRRYREFFVLSSFVR